MSDDYSFNRKQKKEEEIGFSSETCDSLRKGPLAKENLEMLANSSGLTPLNFCVDECNRILNRSHASDGLSTVRPFADIHARGLDSDPLNKELSQSTEIQRCLSGLCVPLGLSVEIQKRRNLNER
jgi:hypothetical protein